MTSSILGNDPDVIESAFKRLANGGIFNVVSAEPVERAVSLDVGRMHYDNLMTVGTATADLVGGIQAGAHPLEAGRLGLDVGRGRSHGPHALAASAGDDEQAQKGGGQRPERSSAWQITADKFAGLAAENGVELVCFSGSSFDSQEAFAERMMEETDGNGFDDIVVSAPSPRAVESAIPFLAENAVMNVFAGLPRGTQANIDINVIIAKGVRFTGTSGSSIDDLRNMLELTESHTLSTNRWWPR